MLKTRCLRTLLAIGLTLWPASLYAQTPVHTSLQAFMYEFFLEQVVLARTPGGVGVVAHDPVFANDPTVTNVTDLIRQVSQQISSQVSTFPLGSSSGGFTYRYDASLGTFTRTSETFGPAFAERGLTIGRKKASFGMNYQHAKYSSLDGYDLEGGDITFFLLHQPLNPPSFVEGDVIEAKLKLKLTSDTVVFFGNFGVTDAFDIGLALPIQHVNMNLTYHATILDFATKLTDPTRHTFADGTKSGEFSASQSATGIGDVVVRAKYNFMTRGSNAVAVAMDLRLPTGDEENMLGAGGAQAQLYLITSGTMGKIAPHINVGFTAAGGDARNQVNFVGGAEFLVSPKMTFAADLVGRTFLDTLRLTDTDLPHTFRQSPTGAIESTVLNAIETESGSVTSMLGTAGVKFNPAPNLLISAHVVVSLNNAGLRSRFTPVFGFDFSF